MLFIKYIENPNTKQIINVNEAIEAREIWNGAHICGRGYTNGILPDGHPFSTSDYALLSQLPRDEQDRAHDWVEKYCKFIKSYNRRNTSYGLKHILYNLVCVYMTNNQFKDLMLLHGYKPEDKNGLYWRFQISEKGLKQSEIDAKNKDRESSNLSYLS